MSTDISTLKPAGVQLPAAFQGKTAAAVFKTEVMEKGSEGIEGSYGIIKFAGKVWSLQYRGENRKFMRPDGDGPRGSIDVLFIRSAVNKAKTFYPPGFKDGSKEKPICWSNDGVKPDPAVPPSQKGAPACAACKNNVFGSRVTDDGKPSKACGDHKRNAVVIDPKLVEVLLGMPLSEPVLLRIPAASLNDFASFSDTMNAQGFPLQSFICKISFDPTKNFPKFNFEAVRPLDAAEAEIVMAFRHDPMSTRIISESAVVNDGADTAVEEAQGSATNGTLQGTVQGPNLGTGQAGAGKAYVQPQGTSAEVVSLNIAPRAEALNPNPPQDVKGPTGVPQNGRPTPAEQAAAMAAAQAQPQDVAEPGTGTTALDASINDQIAKLLG